LTAVFGGLFLCAGVVLLGATYALVSQQLARSGDGASFTQSDDSGSAVSPGGARDAPEVSIVTPDGERLTGRQADEWLREGEDRIRGDATRTVLTQGGIALVVVGAAAVGLGWLVSGRVLQPLARVTDTARRIAAAPVADRSLHERIDLTGPDDEVKDLADSFDTMLERLDQSFAGQRRFVANASHELRTPLTVGRALIEVAMHRKTASEDVRQLGESLLTINARHERLITGLLLLAASDHEIPGRVPVDLADVVDHVVGQTAAEAADRQVSLRSRTEETVTDGDALLLERLVHNLVENGIRHNEPSGSVEVSCHADPEKGRVTLEVVNTGPLVPTYEVTSLFQPFRRLDRDRLVSAEGVGLGLSIVESVARAHGGRVSARSRDNGGLVVTVHLPASRTRPGDDDERPAGADVQP
jgi:signal transduction histidine kinase